LADWLIGCLVWIYYPFISTRTDLGKKLERQKQEYEDKLAFLLLQLRGAEQQAQAQATLLRTSLSLEGAGGEGLRRRGGDQLGQARISASALGYLRPRPRTAQSYLFPGSAGAESARAGAGAGGEGAEGREELLRKYLGEKQRREVLERRNGELARELREQSRVLSQREGDQRA
jgi:hypothetical protein